MRLLRRIVLTLLAMLFLFEAWLWEHLGPAVRFLVGLLPFRTLKEKIAAALERLPPYPSLVLFAVPGVLLFPFKLAAFWFIARGQVAFGGFVFFAAKVVGFGVTAFIFETTRPKLMQLAWFTAAYEWCLWAKGWAKAQVEPHTAWLRRKLAMFRRERRARLVAVLGRLRQRVARRRAAGR